MWRRLVNHNTGIKGDKNENMKKIHPPEYYMPRQPRNDLMSK